MCGLVQNLSNIGRVIHIFKQFVMSGPFCTIVQAVLDSQFLCQNACLIGSDAVVCCLDSPTDDVCAELKRVAEDAVADYLRNYAAMGIGYVEFQGIEDLDGSSVIENGNLSPRIPICGFQSNQKIDVDVGIPFIQVSVTRVAPKVNDVELRRRFSAITILDDSMQWTMMGLIGMQRTCWTLRPTQPAMTMIHVVIILSRFKTMNGGSTRRCFMNLYQCIRPVYSSFNDDPIQCIQKIV